MAARKPLVRSNHLEEAMALLIRNSKKPLRRQSQWPFLLSEMKGKEEFGDFELREMPCSVNQRARELRKSY
jgi:hypothetical protein